MQRLAELILYPKKHYRYLPPYLRALDRVVSVSSPISIFPLPQAQLPHSGGILNGVSATPVNTAPVLELGSDESLGGALLTPIPWLTNSQRSSGTNSSTDKELQISNTEIVEGPNGAGLIETVDVVNGVMVISRVSASALASTEEALRAEGAVTQGELLRQEQEAGVVPVQPRGLRLSDEELEQVSEEERPHARGPDDIGMEDTGPQDRHVPGAPLDMEHAVGRSRRESSVERDLDPEDASLSDAGGGREEEMKDAPEEAVAEMTATADAGDLVGIVAGDPAVEVKDADEVIDGSAEVEEKAG